MSIEDPTNKSLVNLFLLFIITGAALAVWQLLFDRSVWLDEASLALNIFERDFRLLLQPLEYTQVAPVGFLLVEKCLSVLFIENTITLRLFPLICFLFSIYFFYVFAKTLTGDKTLSLLATGMFGLSLTLIDYATEIKQYSTEMLLALMIFTIVLKTIKDRYQSMLSLALTGALSVWFSHTAIIVLFVSSFYLFMDGIIRHRKKKLLYVFFGWFLSFAVYYHLFIHGHPSKQVMLDYFRAANGFLPLNPFATDFYHFLYQACREIFAMGLSYGRLWFVPATFSLFALYSLLIKQQYRMLYFCISPIVLHFILSALELYPVTIRTLLYIMPIFIFLFTYGIYEIYKQINANYYKLPKQIIILPLLVQFYPLYLAYPIEKEELKNSLDYVQQHIQEGDTIYIYNSAYRSLLFYQLNGSFSVANPVIAGNYHREHPARYQQELSSLTGKVWLLFSHVYEGDVNEEAYIMNFLETNGAEIVDKRNFTGSSVHYVVIN